MFYNFQNLKFKYQLSYKQYTEFESLCYVNEVPVLLLYMCCISTSFKCCFLLLILLFVQQTECKSVCFPKNASKSDQRSKLKVHVS